MNFEEIKYYTSRRITEIWKYKEVNSIILISPFGLSKLNETGSFIWQYLDGKITINNVLEKLCSAYFMINKKELQANLLDFIAYLLKNNLIVLNWKSRIQNTNSHSLLYLISLQVFTPPSTIFFTTYINYFTYWLCYVFYLQHTSVYGFCYSFLTNNVTNTYKYFPCCTNKYIFLMGRNKFIKHIHP